MKVFMVMLFIGIYFAMLSAAQIYRKPQKFQAIYESGGYGLYAASAREMK